jgi:hypothetical protein
MIGCRGQFLDWNYTPAIDFESPITSASGPNILVGNSAHYTNNHLEIFKKLKKLKLEFEMVIVPLSYGDPVYRGSILSVGEKIFGKHFWGIQEYLPIHRYTEIVSSCSLAFFNSVRQQATGNVLLMVFLGARVFLREENPALNYLLRNGLQVFSIQKHLRKNDSSLYAPLSNDVIKKNRAIIKMMFGEEELDQKTKTLVAFLRAKKQPR